jgi:predicted RNA polymerase sigma factor
VSDGDASPGAASAAVDGLFRREAGRIAAAAVRLLGFGNLDLAEDIVQDVLVQALETWKFGGLPANPAAWLMTAAKNRAVDVIRRARTARRFAPDVADLLSTEWSTVPTIAAAFFPGEIADAQLRLMFGLCDGRLPHDTQVMVLLKYLCGFGVRELAHAFLSGPDAIEKRLGRARATLQADGALTAIDDPEALRVRGPAVQRALYFMFNEGYHGSHPEEVVREDLCSEALRLTTLLAGHPRTATPEVYALLALMCLLAARLRARRDRQGDLVPLEEQDRAAWDRELLARGLAALDESASGPVLTETHLEAAIAAEHASARTFQSTDWRRIVALYDQLGRLRPSPVVALNRAVAVGQADGPAAGLAELDAIEAAGQLDDYLFLAAARADLLRRAGRHAEACLHYRRARQLARNEPEARFFSRRLGECGDRDP